MRSFKKDYTEALDCLCKHFQSSYKAYKWLHSENVFFGDKKPIEMMLIGRGHKVLNFIKFAIEENSRD